MFSYFLFLSLLIIFINANEQFHIGSLNHNTQWYIHCLENNTRILTPPFNDQPLISYQCPYPSYAIDILPIEIDFTFICRLQSRLIWIMVDLYQYNFLSWSIDTQELNISIKLNQQIQIKDSKQEINNYKNRFIIINAFYIPFESLESLANQQIEILVLFNQCTFYIHDNSTWNDIIQKDCNSIESKTLTFQYAKCDFFPQSKVIDTTHGLEVQVSEDNTTSIHDFNVVLSIDEQTTTTTSNFPDYHLLFEEQYRKILSGLARLSRASRLLLFIFIFTLIILVLLIIFFIYVLCYHYRIESTQKSSYSI